MEVVKIGIVGLGLIGGSFGKALKKYNLASKIVGYDHNQTHQKEAMELCLVDEIVELDELIKSDMIVLCIPVDAIIAFLPKLVSCVEYNTTIIDFGSTKELIVKSIPNELKSCYIPAHPMTGTEKFGPSAAIDELYENKTMVLCDLESAGDIHKNRAIQIFETLKMKLVFMNSHDHDIHACYMSHLPHAISFALANMVMNHERPKDIISLAAGGFKDMSRIAKSSPNMWSDIFRQNRVNLLESLDIYEKQIGYIKKILQNEDYERIEEWMKKSNTLHDIL
jgi:prephenate dehydrogenase